MTGRRGLEALALAALVGACDPYPNVGPVHESVRTPQAFAPLPPALTCEGDVSRPVVAAVRLGAPSPPTPGQMTDACMAAKRLYDAEKWEAAVAAFRDVAAGTSGDDEGNRQTAEYRIGVALLRLRRFGESAATFHAIARNRDHVKHGEALLFIARLAFEHPDSFDLGDLAFYGRAEVDRFDNVEQLAIWGGLTYLLGRARLAAGARAEARDLFARVPTDHPYAAYARRCAGVL